jgi:hypothetical protein
VQVNGGNACTKLRQIKYAVGRNEYTNGFCYGSINCMWKIRLVVKHEYQLYEVQQYQIGLKPFTGAGVHNLLLTIFLYLLVVLGYCCRLAVQLQFVTL